MPFLGPYADPNEALGLSKTADTNAIPSLGLKAPEAPTINPSQFGVLPQSSDPVAKLPAFTRWLIGIKDREAKAMGQVPPSDILRARQRKADMQQIQFIRGQYLDAADTAVDLPEDKRSAYIDARANAFEQQYGPGQGDIFKSLYKRRAALDMDIQKSPTLTNIYNVSGLEGVGKAYQSPEMIDRIGAEADAANLPGILRKLTKAIPWLQKNQPKEWAAANADGLQSHEILTLNELLQEGRDSSKLTPGELNTMQHSESPWRAMNIEPPSDVKLRAEERIKRTEEARAKALYPSPENTAANTNAELRAREQFLQQTRGIRDAVSSFDTLERLTKGEPSAQRDLGTTISWYKIYDPDSAVLSAEVVTARAQGVLDNLKTAAPRFFTGQFLNANGLRHLRDTAKASLKSRVREHQVIEESFRKQATGQALNPENVVTNLVPQSVRDMANEADVKQPLPDGVPEGSVFFSNNPNGTTTYKTPDGKYATVAAP